MSWLKLWQPIKVNRSDRPILEEGEFNVYIKDNVGLYQGKQKIIHHQNGRLYLTNRRIIYFDNNNVKNSIAVDINQLTSAELIERFLRSSPKVKLYLKAESREGADVSVAQSTTPGFDWVCKICSFKNHISGIIDADTAVPVCIACGVPNKNFRRDVVQRSGDGGDSSTQRSSTPSLTNNDVSDSSPSPTSSTPEPSSSTNPTATGQCPTCTFINHKSLKYCEMCGTQLKSSIFEVNQSLVQVTSALNPLGLKLEGEEQYTNGQPYIKISFRKGGESQFFQEIATLIDEIKWDNLRRKGGVNQNAERLETRKEPVKAGGAGIHALEAYGEQQRKNNERILSSSLNDLEQLMFKFEDLVKLSTSFQRVLASDGNIVYKSVPPLNLNRNSKLYHSELSRHISEYLTSLVLTKKSSMITLPDLFAQYNRFLVKCSGFGTELVEVADFRKSVDLFESLNLPVVSNRYEKSGLVVVRPKAHAHTYSEFIVEFLQQQEYRYKRSLIRSELIDGDDDDYDDNDNLNHEYGCYGATASEISHTLNWSYGVAMEELDKAIGSNQVVIDQSISGTFYYVNKFAATFDWDDSLKVQQIKDEIVEEQRGITEHLKEEYENSKVSNLLNLDAEYEFGVVSQHVDDNNTHQDSSAGRLLNGLEGLQF
ncbi:VPS36 [Candida theae]|uniref:Vacuolar protein-sorting-associated protein 36 n=1 Tax=Candida theae TaxID=1198502 RepID=A0AAD5FWQ7_9ASCO|nr:VPS36 [Candida theae]KAI5949957.1 VPS36 [Candida theae]